MERVLTPDELYKACLKLYKVDEIVSRETLESKKKQYLRSYHPDKVTEESIKIEFTQKFQQYINAYQIICARRGWT